jgi:single-strand DNA-binding protein
MKNLKNRVNLIGNLGTDPEIKNLDGGQKLAKIAIATNESYKNNKGEKVTETQWHNLVAWGKTAEYFEKYAKTGSKAVIEGKLVNRNYTDKSGIKRFITEIVVDEVMLFGAGTRNDVD